MDAYATAPDAQSSDLAARISDKRKRKKPDFYHDEAWESDATASDNSDAAEVILAENEGDSYLPTESSCEATQQDIDILDEMIAALAEREEGVAYASDASSQELEPFRSAKCRYLPERDEQRPMDDWPPWEAPTGPASGA